MDHQPESQDLHLAQTENRHLKETISALREELEKMRISSEASIQNAVVAANGEIVQLKSTIAALRDELEWTLVQCEEKIQKMEQMTRDEMNQLQQTVKTLREQLEEYEREQK
jgi:HAMP domain-containing protein